MKIKSLMVVLGVLCALYIGWYVLRNPQVPPPAGTKLVLGAEPVLPSSPVWIAEHEGYFRDAGLDVEIRKFESGRTALYTMLDKGEIDMATAAQTPVISRCFDRNDYAIVAGMMSSDNDVKLLARRDRGIASPADLKGKTVGITSGSSGHYFLSLFLAYNQIDQKDVALRDCEPAALENALVAGDVDGIATWEPHVYRAKKALGEKAVLLPSSNLYREDFYFVCRKDFIARQPEALKRFLRAVERGEQFIARYPRAAQEIIGKRVNMEPEVIDATWSEFQFGLFLDQAILDSLESEARWAGRAKPTGSGAVPNFLDFIYTDALSVVKPEAVTIAGRGR